MYSLLILHIILSLRFIAWMFKFWLKSFETIFKVSNINFYVSLNQSIIYITLLSAYTSHVRGLSSELFVGN